MTNIGKTTTTEAVNALIKNLKKKKNSKGEKKKKIKKRKKITLTSRRERETWQTQVNASQTAIEFEYSVVSV